MGPSVPHSNIWKPSCWRWLYFCHLVFDSVGRFGHGDERGERTASEHIDQRWNSSENKRRSEDHRPKTRRGEQQQQKTSHNQRRAQRNGWVSVYTSKSVLVKTKSDQMRKWRARWYKYGWPFVGSMVVSPQHSAHIMFEWVRSAERSSGLFFCLLLISFNYFFFFFQLSAQLLTYLYVHQMSNASLSFLLFLLFCF